MDTVKDRLQQLCVRSGKDYRALALAKQGKAPGAAKTPGAQKTAAAAAPAAAAVKKAALAFSGGKKAVPTTAPAPAAAKKASSTTIAPPPDLGPRPTSADVGWLPNVHLTKRPPVAVTGELFYGVFADGELYSKWVQMVTDEDMTTGNAMVMTPFGKNLWVSRCAEGPEVEGQEPLRAAYFTCDMLCGPRGCRKAFDQGGPMAAPDYLALAKEYHRIYIEGVPTFMPKQREEALRFVTMVDVLYEVGTRVFASASLPGDNVCVGLLHAAAQHGVDPNLGRKGRPLPKHGVMMQVRVAAASCERRDYYVPMRHTTSCPCSACSPP